MTGDVGKPLEGAQRRFASRSVEEFLESAERAGAVGPRRPQHPRRSDRSDRANPRGGPPPKSGVPHARRGAAKEIEAAIAHYGKRPLELLLDRLEIGPETTAVHCTHSREEDLDRFLETGANVCVTPLTEANLADGFVPPSWRGPGAHLSLGTDSNLRIDFSEEMRLLEYAPRLREQKRGVYRRRIGLRRREAFRDCDPRRRALSGASRGRNRAGRGLRLLHPRSRARRRSGRSNREN